MMAKVNSSKSELLKTWVLTHYGNGKLACVQCGFKDIRALSIDHINGGGLKHIREIKGSLYRWLIENDYPEGYQTLCMNCQFIKKYTLDMPRYLLARKRKAKTIGRQVRKLIESIHINIYFNTGSIISSLKLEPKDARKVRFVLCRMVDKGEIQRVGFNRYRKLNLSNYS